MVRYVIVYQCAEMTHDPNEDKAKARRAELEAEQQRLVTAFTKGYLAESEMDERVSAIQRELLTIPRHVPRNIPAMTKAAIAAGETLGDMAGYWHEAMPEERRDMVWALLTLGGMHYDLQRQAIVAFTPRQDVLPGLTLGLAQQWEQREGGLWLREAYLPPMRPARMNPHAAYQQPKAMTPEQEREVLALLRQGKKPRRLAKQLNLSYYAIWRLMRKEMPPQMQSISRVLTVEQAKEAKGMVAQGMTLRQVAKHFGVSHSAVWRLMHMKGGEA